MHKEKGAKEREREKKGKKECFPRDWDISREERRGGRRRRKKDGTHLWLC